MRLPVGIGEKTSSPMTLAAFGGMADMACCACSGVRFKLISLFNARVLFSRAPIITPLTAVLFSGRFIGFTRAVAEKEDEGSGNEGRSDVGTGGGGRSLNTMDDELFSRLTGVISCCFKLLTCDEVSTVGVTGVGVGAADVTAGASNMSLSSLLNPLSLASFCSDVVELLESSTGFLGD